MTGGMNMPVNPAAANPAAVTPAAQQPSATDATTAAAAASANAPASYTSNTTISSLSDLKNKAPKVYKFMMLSIAQNICIQMEHDQDELTALWKQIRNDSDGPG
jgi:hypothetical protein